MQRWAQRSS